MTENVKFACQGRFPNRTHVHVHIWKSDCYNGCLKYQFPCVLSDHCQFSCRTSQGEWVDYAQCREYVGNLACSNVVNAHKISTLHIEKSITYRLNSKISTSKPVAEPTSKKGKNIGPTKTKRPPLPLPIAFSFWHPPAENLYTISTPRPYKNFLHHGLFAWYWFCTFEHE